MDVGKAGIRKGDPALLTRNKTFLQSKLGSYISLCNSLAKNLSHTKLQGQPLAEKTLRQKEVQGKEKGQ